MIWYDYFNGRSKADRCQLNLPHRTKIICLCFFFHGDVFLITFRIKHSNGHKTIVCVCVCVCVLSFCYFIYYLAKTLEWSARYGELIDSRMKENVLWSTKFLCCPPTVWNNLTKHLHTDDISHGQFITELKMVLFAWAFLSEAPLRTLVLKGTL